MRAATPTTRFFPAARLRASSAPGGGASSLLRLSSTLQQRLPSAAAIDAWAGRALRPLRTA